MVKKFKNKTTDTINPKDILKLVNNFRTSQGRDPLPKEKQKLVTYNEAIFLRPIKIHIVAIFGPSHNSQAQYLSKKYHVDIFPSAKDFFDTKIKHLK